jgi:hypothetical protein
VTVSFTPLPAKRLRTMKPALTIGYIGARPRLRWSNVATCGIIIDGQANPVNEGGVQPALPCNCEVVVKYVHAI